MSAAPKRRLPRGSHLPVGILRDQTLLGANQAGGSLINSSIWNLLVSPWRFWPSGLLLLPDHPQDHVRQPSRHHPGVEAQSGPRRHREPERRQTGQKHLLPVPNPAEQLPWGLRRLAASGKISLSLIGGEEFGGSTKLDSFLGHRVWFLIPPWGFLCLHHVVVKVVFEFCFRGQPQSLWCRVPIPILSTFCKFALNCWWCKQDKDSWTWQKLGLLIWKNVQKLVIKYWIWFD